MRKVIIFICLGLLVLALSACTSDSEETTLPTQPTEKETTQPQPTEQTEPTNGDDESGDGAAAIADKILESVSFPEMMEVSDKRLELFYSLTSDILKDYKVYISSVNVKADEIAVFEAKDGQVDSVLLGIKDRIAMQEDSFKEYLPAEYNRITDNILKVSGNFILFCISADNNTCEEIFNEMVE